MKSSNKITVTIADLPPFVTTRSSQPLTEEYDSILTDFQEFLREVELRLLRIRYEGQKNRLYKITLVVGNFDHKVEPWLGDAPYRITKTNPLPSQFIPDLIHGTASAVALDETL